MQVDPCVAERKNPNGPASVMPLPAGFNPQLQHARRSILARYGALNGDRECIDTAGEAMLYSCERQLPNALGTMASHRCIAG